MATETREPGLTMPTMKRTGPVMVATLLLTVLLAGCDTLDFTEVTNPNTTTDDLARAAEPTRALLPGVRAQMARGVRAVVQTTDMVSDNFEIAFTNVGGELSDPYALNPEGPSFNSTGAIGAYWNLQELRALGDFLIDSIAPQDENSTDQQLAEARFYRGMAFLMQGENFVGVPTGADRDPAPAAELLALALDDFTATTNLVDPAGAPAGLPVAALAALARTHRALGNAGEARTFAQQALAQDPDFVWLQGYAASEIENPFPNDTRAFQPLPRLDFLDPKYVERDSPIPVVKAEEMHLILAEVAMSEGDYATAAEEIRSAILLAETRPRTSFTDQDNRGNPDLTIRPRDAAILVRADADSPYRAGLVLTRPGSVTVPAISGTSLDADSVAALAAPEDVRHAFWLARQEMLFLEGRRLHDLGVLMPVMQREIDASPAISNGDAETRPVIPSYIPEDVMDGFLPRSPYLDERNGGELATDQITIEVDMNRILAMEGVSKFGTLP